MAKDMTLFTRLALGTAAFAVLAGCSSNPVGGLFGRGGDAESASVEAVEEEKDDGRVPVLALQQALDPDPQYAALDIVVPPAFANAEWSQPGGEADHVMHHLSGPDTYAPAWTAKIGAGGDKRAPLTSPAVVSDRRVFTVDAEAVVRSFDTGTGEELWAQAMTPDMSESKRRFFNFNRIKPAQYGFGGGVAYEDGRVFMVSGFAIAAGMDATTGEVLWQVDLPAPVRNPPTAVNGKLFVLTTANQIVALDQVTGETIWTHESFEESARFLSTGSVAVDGDVVIAPFSSGEVVALDGLTGRLLWSATVARSSRLNALSNLNDIAGSPVIDRGGVFAVSHSGQLSAIDARTGRVAWEVALAGLNMPWVSGDFLFVVSVDGDLVCLSRDDGGVVWSKALPAFENPKKRKGPITWAGPILVGETLILTSSAGTMIQASPQNGETLQSYKLNGPSTVPPVVADGTLFIVNNKGRLEAWR